MRHFYLMLALLICFVVVFIACPGPRSPDDKSPEKILGFAHDAIAVGDNVLTLIGAYRELSSVSRVTGMRDVDIIYRYQFANGAAVLVDKSLTVISVESLPISISPPLLE
jgi:hypothetical protein